MLIEETAGIYLKAKTGDYIEAGEPIAILYSNKEETFAAAEKRLLASTWVGKSVPKKEPLILDIVE